MPNRHLVRHAAHSAPGKDPHPSADNMARARARHDHDLRNLLYVMASFAQLMRDEKFGPVTPSQREFLRHILDAAAQAQQLLRAPAGDASAAAARAA